MVRLLTEKKAEWARKQKEKERKMEERKAKDNETESQDKGKGSCVDEGLLFLRRGQVFQA